uniref:Endocuticle structural glycoprotein SgAbd-8 n=1 Tax=Cacopsylla melanoneura TaxID=428564 RepID=A0A8D9AK59_9HEMI
MNSIIATVAFAATLCLVNARPQAQGNTPIPIVSFVNEPAVDGTYKFAFETGNGIAVQEQGQLKNPGVKDQEAQTAQGQSSYTAPDGTPIITQWFADETGFLKTLPPYLPYTERHNFYIPKMFLSCGYANPFER